LILLKLRFQGYDNFYIHYSIWSLFITKLITNIAGGKTYLWDCEYYKKNIPNRLLVYALKWTNVIVTGHPKIADQYKKILKLPAKPVGIVHNWAFDKSNLTKPTKKENTSFTNILFVHHISSRKGSRQLPAIIQNTITKLKSLQNNELKPLHFTIIGDGPDLTWLKQKTKLHNMQSYVTFTGKLNHNLTKRYWREADIFIMPSRSEGFPRVLLEAQLYGVPYVATDVGCVREISPKAINKFIVPKSKLNMFPETILKLIELSDKEKKQIKSTLILNAKKYSLKKASSQFIKLFM
jgi:glycosyltransferase involved in cell wall biosynthesis